MLTHLALALLLSTNLFAAPVDSPASTVTTELSVLLCGGQGDCAEEQALVVRAGLATERALERMETLLELDAGDFTGATNQRLRFDESLQSARDAGEKEKWKEVEAAAETALDALNRWPGTIEREKLFHVWYLQGAARLHLKRKQSQSYAYSFRQAASVLDGENIAPPIHDTTASRAFIDEQRKVTLSGKGVFKPVFLQPGTRLHVDGVPMAQGFDQIKLLPGTHRITATLEGRIRTWKADVAILADRSSTVRILFPESDSAVWMIDRISQAFDTLQAPVEVTRLLTDWCVRKGIDEVRLLRVETLQKPLLKIPVTLTDPPSLRPKAAEAEPIDLGDGVPSTFEEHLLTELEARKEKRPDPDERRVRVVWFDPGTRRFHADHHTETHLEPDPEGRFKVGVETGYLSLMERNHATMGLYGAGRVGPLHLETRLGFIHADHAYNIYPDLVDQNLYHVLVDLRWNPMHGRVRPVLGLGPELYIPVAYGARGFGGVEADLGRGWQGRLEAQADLLNQGLGLGATMGLAFVQ